jgi:hypothetical protein
MQLSSAHDVMFDYQTFLRAMQASRMVDTSHVTHALYDVVDKYTVRLDGASMFGKLPNSSCRCDDHDSMLSAGVEQDFASGMDGSIPPLQTKLWIIT